MFVVTDAVYDIINFRNFDAEYLTAVKCLMLLNFYVSGLYCDVFISFLCQKLQKKYISSSRLVFIGAV